MTVVIYGLVMVWEYVVSEVSSVALRNILCKSEA